MYYHFHMFRRLRKILPSALLLNIYKTYVQSKIDYGLSIWGCTTEVNLNRVQRIQNVLARIICNNFDYIHSRGIDLVRSLKLQTIRERRDYFLCVLMFKCIHGLAPHYLSNDVTMHVDIHGYDTRSAENMDLYIPRCAKEIYKRSFLYKGSSLWNKLPPWVKESTSLNDFKHNHRLLNGWMHSEFIVPFMCTSILYPILMLSFYQFCLQLDRYNHIRNLSQSYHDIDAFMYDLYLWMCIYVFLCLCVLLWNRAPWKNSVTEWFTLYKYIWKKKKKKKKILTDHLNDRLPWQTTAQHYNDVILSAMASQITGVSIVCSTVCSGTYQRKRQSSASLAFVTGIHRWPVNSPHKGPVTRKMFPFDDVIMVMVVRCVPLILVGW